MKKILLFLVALAGLVSCQIIKQEDRYIKMEEGVEGERNVLLLDFTGWQCINCPDAAQVANGLVSRYGEHVIVVSMHPEGISFTDPGTDGPKFATQEAMDYLKAFGGSNTLPIGVVDGQQYEDSYFLKYQQWAAAVIDRLDIDVEYSMEMKASTTTCSVTLNEKSSSDRNVNVVMWLLEDSIIAPQLSRTEGTITEYAHRHVFRKCLNGTDIWGEPAEFQGGTAYLSANYKLPELEGRNFVIVAVAFDADTHEVLQAEEVELKQSGVVSFEIIYNEEKLKDGDTIDIYEVERDFSTQMAFNGYFNSLYTDEHEFFIYEERYFDSNIYGVTMCLFGDCRSDDVENPGTWGPYNFDGLSENDFQSHVTIPADKINEEVTLETDYTFTDGVTNKTIRVRFHYVPEEPIEE